MLFGDTYDEAEAEALKPRSRNGGRLAFAVQRRHA